MCELALTTLVAALGLVVCRAIVRHHVTTPMREHFAVHLLTTCTRRKEH